MKGVSDLFDAFTLVSESRGVPVDGEVVVKSKVTLPRGARFSRGKTVRFLVFR